MGNLWGVLQCIIQWESKVVGGLGGSGWEGVGGAGRDSVGGGVAPFCRLALL